MGFGRIGVCEKNCNDKLEKKKKIGIKEIFKWIVFQNRFKTGIRLSVQANWCKREHLHLLPHIIRMMSQLLGSCTITDVTYYVTHRIFNTIESIGGLTHRFIVQNCTALQTCVIDLRMAVYASVQWMWVEHATSHSFRHSATRLPSHTMG